MVKEVMTEMKFGIFLAPFHPPGQDPALAYERDLELVEWLDQLGYDEAFIGEHHSAGWEIIPSPEIFMATAAARTPRIMLGSGVVSVPYHHPFNIANRYAMLDQITRGRVILGCGPGALPGDAYMLGIDPATQRKRLIEGVKAIRRLFTEEGGVTIDGSWFKLNDAHLQVKPFQKPHPQLFVASLFSPSGMMAAGELGVGLLSLLGFVRGFGELKDRWTIVEETAAEHGNTVDRKDWRLVLPFHLAESRQEALDDVRVVGDALIRNYFSAPVRQVEQGQGSAISAMPLEQLAAEGGAILGTPDDAVARIRELQEVSGGFGGFMNMAVDWTTREKTMHSYELFARHVAPVFRDNFGSIPYSVQWTADRRAKLMERGGLGVRLATQEYLEKKSPGKHPDGNAKAPTKSA
jgi:limonene 1,2-monooxygenase